MQRALGAFLLVLAAFSLACGFMDNSSSSSSFDCCVNGSFYDCPDADALETCSPGQEIECSREPSRDDECE